MSWFWFALAAAILWGFGYTINQVTLKHFSAIELIFFESLIICIIFGIYFIYKGNFNDFTNKLSNPRHLGLLLASSFICTIASIFIFKSISSSNAALAAIIESCYPIFTILFAFILFGEIQLNIMSALGFILVLTGIIIVKIYGK